MSEVSHTILEFKALPSNDATVAVLTLNRPDQANSFSMQMMEEITFHMKTVGRRADCRALIVAGKGKHFSAGADLNWMQKSAKLTYNENVIDSQKLSTMFESIVNLKVPTIAAAKGAVMGGGVGLVAACDFAVAHKDTKFCLSESRLGLLPAVIAPYLARKIKSGQLKRLALTSQVFTASEALEYGLIEIVAEESLTASLNKELASLLKCGPESHTAIKSLMNELRIIRNDQTGLTVNAIASARTGQEGQAGLNAFFTKGTAPWVVNLDENQTFIEES